MYSGESVGTAPVRQVQPETRLVVSATSTDRVRSADSTEETRGPAAATRCPSRRRGKRRHGATATRNCPPRRSLSPSSGASPPPPTGRSTVWPQLDDVSVSPSRCPSQTAVPDETIQGASPDHADAFALGSSITAIKGRACVPARYRAKRGLSANHGAVIACRRVRLLTTGLCRLT